MLFVSGSGLFLFSSCSSAYASDPVSDFLLGVGVDRLRLDHINGNVPDFAAFDSVLKRDLDSYFGKCRKKAVKTSYELLRKTATQVGVAYPKYYAWVRVSDAKSADLLEQGVVRLAAKDKKEFEITHFLPASEICNNPALLSEIIPRSLCAGAEQRARACLAEEASKSAKAKSNGG